MINQLPHVCSLVEDVCVLDFALIQMPHLRHLLHRQCGLAATDDQACSLLVEDLNLELQISSAVVIVTTFSISILLKSRQQWSDSICAAKRASAIGSLVWVASSTPP